MQAHSDAGKRAALSRKSREVVPMHRSSAQSARRMTRAMLALVVASACAAALTPAQAQAGRAAHDEGRRLLRIGDAAKAEKQFERAIKLEPGVGAYHLGLGQAVGIQAGTASVVRQPFMARRIKAEFEKAVALDPSLLDARDGLIQFHLMAPGFMGGNPAEAQAQQREIAKRDAVRGHMAQAGIAWHEKDTVATERALRAAIAAAPDSAGPVIMLAGRQAGWNRITDAFATYDAFLARRPEHAGARYNYGRLAVITEQNLPRAERYFRELTDDSVWSTTNWTLSRAAVYARLGDALRLQGKSADARGAYQAALEIDKDFQLAKDGLKALN